MKNSADRGGCYPPKLKAEVDKFLDDVIELASLVQYMTVQPLVMVNCACGSTQSETGEYFEWIIIALIHQGQVVRKVDNTIYCINPFPVDNIIGPPNTYPFE